MLDNKLPITFLWIDKDKGYIARNALEKKSIYSIMPKLTAQTIARFETFREG